MIYPTVDELTKGKFNRYELVVGVAKCASRYRTWSDVRYEIYQHRLWEYGVRGADCCYCVPGFRAG